MKKLASLIMIICAASSVFGSISFNDIDVWAGSGSNRAAMIVYWSPPEVYNNTTMPAPIADVAIAWGYNFEGSASGWDMMSALAQADSKLYVVGDGSLVAGIGYDLDGDGQYGLSNGITTYTQQDFNAGILENVGYGADSYLPTDSGDLYWGGWNGPNWLLWHEQGGNGGFTTSPNRGSDTYWTTDYGWDGYHGQWDYYGMGIGSEIVEDGSWMGWSIASGGLEYYNPTALGTIAWYEHKQAPIPEPATVCLLAVGGLLLKRR